MIELKNIDCMDFMATLKDKAFDLAICDVNYGIKQDGRQNHTRGALAKAKDYRNNFRYDDKCPDELYFNELLRVSENQILWGANHFISNIPFNSSCWIVWDKRNEGNDFADCELAYTSFETAVRIFRYKWNGMLQENMKDKEERIHPNQKPVALYKWLLKNYASPRDRIIDTHGGSMSIAIACHQMGFDLVLCEIDKDYYEAGVKRYVNAIKQQTLFAYS